MHPDPAFGWSDPTELRAFAAGIGFAHLFVSGADGIAVAHVAMLVARPDRVQFHLPHRNRAAPLIAAGGRMIASFGGPHGYVSPDYYGIADQVPTWNYLAVEAEGTAVRLDDAGLVAHLDALSAWNEARLAPKPAWTRAAMDPARFDAMLPAIGGYDLHVSAWRGTAKLTQNKPAAAVPGVIAGLAAAGDAALADHVRAANGARA